MQGVFRLAERPCSIRSSLRGRATASIHSSPLPLVGCVEGQRSLNECRNRYRLLVVKQLQAQNAQSVSEALRYRSGCCHRNLWSRSEGYDWIMMRGFNAQATSSYLDGLRQVSSSYSFFRTDPYALNSVEVLRGPSSALYGQSDAGGIVNKTSKKPTETMCARSSFSTEVMIASRPRSILAVPPIGREHSLPSDRCRQKCQTPSSNTRTERISATTG